MRRILLILASLIVLLFLTLLGLFAVEQSTRTIMGISSAEMVFKQLLSNLIFPGR